MYFFVLFCCLVSDQVYNSAAQLAGKTSAKGIYMKSTAGGNMRRHIDTHHSELYLTKAVSKGWEIKLASQSKSRIDATDGSGPGSPCSDNFSIEKLHSALVNLITADDQV